MLLLLLLLGLARSHPSRTAGGGGGGRADGRERGRTGDAQAGLVMVMDQAAVRGRVGIRVGAGGRRWFSFAAADRAKDESTSGQERPAQQRGPARVATEASVRGVPVLAFVSHLT